MKEQERDTLTLQWTYIHTYIHQHTCMYNTQAHAYTRTTYMKHIRTHAYTYTTYMKHIHTHAYIYMSCIFTHTHTCIHAQMHTHTHMHTCPIAHTHTHTHTCSVSSTPWLGLFCKTSFITNERICSWRQYTHLHMPMHA